MSRAREYDSIDPETSRISTRERGAVRVAAQAARAAQRALRGDRRDQAPRPLELLVRHASEVLLAQHLLPAPGADLDLAPVDLGPGAGDTALAALALPRRRSHPAELRLAADAEEP